MSDYQRDIAGHFSHDLRSRVFALTYRLFPEQGQQIAETAERVVEEDGAQEDVIAVILHWFRSDADAEWVERFRQSPEGGRFLDLMAEVTFRSTMRRFFPEVPLPPPGA